MPKKSNGPCVYPSGEMSGYDLEPGLYFRDHLAAMAMQALIAVDAKYQGCHGFLSTAEDAYRYADAMIAMRDK